MTDPVQRLARDAADRLPQRLHGAMLPLGCTLAFLQTGAHPDDETSGLLALLRHRFGMRIGFACSTRGEGGQNALSRARGADLAALRTREMEAAAASLGLVLYWLGPGQPDPVHDFRFSKSAEETLAIWGEERVLERLVRVLRIERPDMVCPTFLDVPGQHGHHRAMTRLARKAYEIAGDRSTFPEHAALGLAPWAPAKFYLPAWSGAGDSYDDAEPPPRATTPLDIGAVDPALGVSYARIGEWSRRFHRTQGMGRWPEPGPQPRPLHLAASVHGPVQHEASPSDGLPATLADWAREGAPELLGAHQAILDARALPFRPRDIARLLAEALAGVRAAHAGLRRALHDRLAHRLVRQEAALARALFVASGGQASLDAPALAVPGRRIRLAAVLDGPAVLRGIALPPGWRALHGDGLDVEPHRVEPDLPAAHPNASDASADHRLVPVIAWDPDAPADRPALRVAVTVEGIEAVTSIPAAGATVLLPALTATPDTGALVANRRAGPCRLVLPVVLAATDAGGTATLGLGPAPGIDATPATLHVDAQGRAETALEIAFDPARIEPGTVVPLLIDGAPAQLAWHETHPHLGQVHRTAPAVLRLAAPDVAIPDGAQILYVGGGNDRVDDWLRRIGIACDTVPPGGLDGLDLARWTTLLVGIFGFGMRPDLAAATPRIHDFVRAGGHLVTLYHRPGDGWLPDRTPLAPLSIGRPSLRFRVTDAAAPVTVLVPGHPLLAGPNPIGAAEWSGWRRERGLYFARAWDDSYEPLVELADPGEPPLRGALLSGHFGHGRHTHVALSLHTELDALTEGAFRLMANLVQPA